MGKGHWNSHGLVLSQAWKRADFYGSDALGGGGGYIYGFSAPAGIFISYLDFIAAAALGV